MKPLRSLGIACIAASAAACAIAPLPPRVSGGAPPQGEVAVFVDALNAHRRSIGCPALVWDPAVAEVAQAHSEAMRRRGFYGHTDPEGATFTDRLRWGGVVWISAAENIARTTHGAEQVLYLWLQSPGHRANIDNCRFTTHGVGFSGEYWTHLFVTPDPRVGRGGVGAGPSEGAGG